MRRTSHFILALVAGALVCANAQAQSHSKRRPAADQVEQDAAAAQLTVSKKSFLDPGNVVPIGSQDRYANIVKYPAPAPGGTYRNDNFGDWLLPSSFGLPGFIQR
jgi:hypothetical protein